MGCSRPRSAILSDALEPRRMLAADPGVWDITANDASNAISIDYRAADARLLAKVDGQVVLTRRAKGITLLSVSAGAGNDRVTINLHRSFRDMYIWINAGSGRDRIEGGVAGEMILGGTGNDTIFAGAGADTLRGGAGSDDEDGGDGDDYVQGNAGSDTLAGGWGGDKLTGGTGLDQLRGGDGEDRLYGGIDPDTLKGGAGIDILDGGGASNMIYEEAGTDLVATTSISTRGTDDTIAPLTRLQTDDQLKQWLIDQSAKQWSSQFGKPIDVYWAYDQGTVVRGSSWTSVGAALDNAAGAPPPASTPTVGGESSQTNTQVVGVDEADRVETDGNLIYLLNGNDLVIADATPASQMKILSRTTIEGSPSGMYLAGTRVAVLSSLATIYPYGGWRGIPTDVVASGSFAPEYFEPKLKLTVFDVSDPSAPKVAEETTMDGLIADSRVIDGRLYLVAQNYLAAPVPKTVKNSSGADVYESESSYRARLAVSDTWRDILPDYTTKADGAESSGKILTAPDVYARAGSRLDVTSVLLFDLLDSATGPLAKTSVVGAQGFVYASRENLYLAGSNWWTNRTSTELVKFGLGADQITLQASGEVEGSILNQFSMDEFGATFRVATTTSTVTTQSSSVFVLDQVGDELVEIGSIGGLGTNERIYSTRFMGDRAYLVTFRQVDPLFVMDLSDPASPKVAGELKIPGFSEYLHPIDEYHLIGLGRSADTDGRPAGVQLSLFDVSNPAKPVQVDVHKFGSDGNQDSSSAAEYDHHAFSYFADQRTLAIPLQRWDSTRKTTLEVLDVDPARGFTTLASLEHQGGIDRSVRIGSDLYSIGPTQMLAFDLEDLPTKLGSLKLSDDDPGAGDDVTVPSPVLIGES